MSVLSTIQSFNPKKAERISNEFKKIREIWFLVLTTGDTDIYSEFVARSIEDLRVLMEEKIHNIEGIIRTET